VKEGRSSVVSNSSSSNSVSNSNNIVFATNDFDFSKYSSSTINPDSNLVVKQMKNNDRMLKEWATPDMVYQPWCIQYLQLEHAQSYELKSGLIYLLPKFHGLASEDPHKYLKEFHVGILKDYIKMKAFPFSLDGAAKD
ncbi:hypothetical protein CR513_00822, partial [Mucuna pruriens]